MGPAVLRMGYNLSHVGVVHRCCQMYLLRTSALVSSIESGRLGRTWEREFVFKGETGSAYANTYSNFSARASYQVSFGRSTHYVYGSVRYR